MKLTLIDEAASISLAQAVFRALPDDRSGWTLLLGGELGAGKSTFARAFIRAAGHEGPVPSPTYTLVEPYDLKSGLIYHIDLYRIASEDELHFLGFDELGGGCSLIEWPERSPGLLTTADLKIDLKYESVGRSARISALSERASGLIQKIN